MTQENVSLKSPDDIQAARKRNGLIILLVLVIAVGAIGALTKGGSKYVQPVKWSPGEVSDTKNLELTTLRAELRGMKTMIEKIGKDTQIKLEQANANNRANFDKKLEMLEAKTNKNASDAAASAKKNSPGSSNIIGEGIPSDVKFTTYELPTPDGSGSTTQKISADGSIPSPPRVKRISAADLQQQTKIPSSNKVIPADDFSVIDPETGEGSDFILTNKEVSASKKYVKNPMAGFIPSTASAPIVLFTGLDAVASGAAQGNPEPVLFRVLDHAFLAGDARYRLSNCNGTAVGFGDLSTTRVKLQATRIVCVDQVHNRLLEAKINGFVTDSDGTLGMRGKLQNREGQLAGKALAASFAEGAANILSSAGTVVSTASGLAQTVSVADNLQNGIAGGTGNAASMLAQRYIEQMEAISPSITVEKGRRAVLHFLAGTKLEWKEYQGAYVEEITMEGGR